MTTLDTQELRFFVYEELIERGSMPSSSRIGAYFGVTPDAARDAIRSARIGKTILPHPVTGEIWMAGPFASAPTAYQLTDGRHTWWANCAWDMLGIVGLVGEPLEIEARCFDCGDPMPMRVEPGNVTTQDAVVHFLVPARRWYDDIGFT